jgi:hypothetical protein
MRINNKAVLDLVSVVGAVTLFGAWTFQQTLLNSANERLQGISSAEVRFETYQSNNALFNAIAAEAVPNAQSEIRRFQTISYELGLEHLAKPLSPEEKAHLPAAPRPYDGDWNFEAAMTKTQRRIEAIQAALQSRRQEVAESSSIANRVFFVLYAAGSLLILAVNIGKIFLPPQK